MKRILFAIAISLFSFNLSSVNAQITETAVDAVKNMGVGWNLGNTLDANSSKVRDFNQTDYWGCQGLESETCWGQPKATKELIDMMKNAGFGAIRVPTTWYNHMDQQGKVDAEWMARVHAVVDYVIDNGLYCILNVHHDTGADSDNHISWIKADESNYETNKDRYEYLWQQIANEFRDYDGHLLFESYNEMLDAKSSWCYASFNTTNQYDLSLASTAYEGINNYAQSFVTTVRSTGGNNATRNLIVNTYAAANGYGTWSRHLKDPLTNMYLPDDSANGHLIFEVHDYPSLATSNNGSVTNRTIADIQKEIDGTISLLNSQLVTSDVPVIIGEWGTSNVDAGIGKTDYDVRRDLMFQFVDYFVKKCKANNIAMFYWMGLSDGQYREFPAFNQADLAECISNAYHGSTSEYEFPTGTNISSISAFEGEKTIYGYNGNINVSGASFQLVGYPMTLAITFKLTSSTKYGYNIQLCYGDWASKPSFTVENKSFNGDCNPTSLFGSTVGTEHTATITFDETTYKALVSKGLFIQGDGITITNVVLNSGTTGITSVTVDDTSADKPVYNLAGQRISKPQHGLYIQGGKVFIAK